MDIIGTGFGIVIFITAGLLTLFLILLAIYFLIAISKLYKLPEILASVENIEKYLKYLVKLEKEKMGVKEEKEPVTESQL